MQNTNLKNIKNNGRGACLFGLSSLYFLQDAPPFIYKSVIKIQRHNEG